MMRLNAPIPVSQQPGDMRSLWRKLVLEGIDPEQPAEATLGVSLFTASVVTGASLLKICNEMVQLGLRAPHDAMPAPWVAYLRGKVLNADTRRDLPYALGALAAGWYWMPMPFVRLTLPQDVCPELDPYGADLCQIYQGELGEAPRFGYRPAQLRAALLRTSMGLGQPVVKVLTDLIERGLVLPPEAVPEASRTQLMATASKDLPVLAAELARAWREAHIRQGHFVAEVVPLRRPA